MVRFSSITTELQIIIAEKIVYFDKKEFELSSKRGKEIVKRTKHKSVVELSEIDINERFMYFRFEFDPERRIEWRKLREIKDLPLFLLRKISINSIDSVHLLSELRDTVQFVDNKVHLDWKDTNYITTPILDVISEISKIGKFTTGSVTYPALLEHPALQGIEVVDIGVEYIPNDTLLQLKCKCSSFRQFADAGRIQVLANSMFKQWFHGERQIDWLYMCVGRNPIIKAYEKQMFSDLPHSAILLQSNGRKRGSFKRRQTIQKRKKFILVNAMGLRQEFVLYTGDGVYFIDREDKKLLVYHSNENGFIVAQEYTNLEDVFEIASE